MAADAVTVHTGAGKASMKAANMRLRDYFTIPNALFRFLDPASIAATCSFDIHWRGPVTDRRHLNDPSVGFAGEFVLSQATMTWSAEGADGSSFVSNPTGTTSVFAQLGHMRNGIFYEG